MKIKDDGAWFVRVPVLSKFFDRPTAITKNIVIDPSRMSRVCYRAWSYYGIWQIMALRRFGYRALWRMVRENPLRLRVEAVVFTALSWEVPINYILYYTTGDMSELAYVEEIFKKTKTLTELLGLSLTLALDMAFWEFNESEPWYNPGMIPKHRK